MKIIEHKAPNVEKLDTNNIKLFLAGSIEMGQAEDWQHNVVESLHHRFKHIQENVTVYIFNPRRTDWDSSWQQSTDNKDFVQQVEWELQHIEKSDIIAFHLQPGTISPISLFELGVVSRDSFRAHKKVIVNCPEGFHRKGNVDIYTMWYDMTRAQNFENFVDHIEDAIHQRIDYIQYHPE